MLINALKPIKSIENIPIQLLSKFYARIYTIDSDFYSILNKDLRNNKEIEISFYLPFIKTLYQGVDLKSLPLVSQDVELYRGAEISIKEIEEIESLKKIFDNLPTVIVFSKVFLSFSKSKDTATDFMFHEQDDHYKPDKNLCKVLFVLFQMRKKEKIKLLLHPHNMIFF